MVDTATTKHRPGVLVIYTGGTIGSKPRDPDPDSPQIVVKWSEFEERTPEIGRLPFVVDPYEEIPALDSCNVGPAEWKQMADAIFANYDEYAGFVILHGTDTMVYTACALSFMLRELGKPVIITGAQRSALVGARNDATQNVLTALEIANPQFSNLPVVPEVCIYFGGKLLRGNRAAKNDTVGYEAYDTPNLAPLGTAGDKILINQKLIRPLPELGRKFHVRTALDTHVMPIFISPGIQYTTIAQAQLETKGLRAAVVLSFGSGNIPTETAFLDAFREARKKNGILLANVSQCPRGPVELGIYETSAALLEAGFVAASDITIEAAQCKLMALLGDPDATLQEVELQYQQNLAGEQSVSLWVTRYGNDSGGTLDDATPRHRIRGVATEGRWNSQFIDRALLRLRGARVTGREIPTEEAGIEIPAEAQQPQEVTDNAPETDIGAGFRVFLNLDPAANPDEHDPTFGGRFKKWPMTSAGVVVFDVTRSFRATTRAGDRLSFTIIRDTPGATLTWDTAELAVFVKEVDA